MPDEVVEEKVVSAKKPIFIYVAVGLVLVLALAGGTAYYVVTNYMGGAKTAATREPGFLMKLGDPKEGFIVNIGTATSHIGGNSHCTRATRLGNNFRLLGMEFCI